jgi:hypothetical protein
MITIEYIDEGATRTLKFETADDAAEWYLNEERVGQCVIHSDTRLEGDQLWSYVEGEMHQ